MTYTISLITGDGIGPELSKSAAMVLDTISDRTHLNFKIKYLEAGDAALEKHGQALPQKTLEGIRASDACLKAPVGESAADVIVQLRRRLDLYANIRPARSYSGVPALHPDIDMVIVRENTEDLYTGAEFDIGEHAVALRIISRRASERIARKAFQMAEGRRRKVTCVHKSNVLRITDGLFVQACLDVAGEYPEVEFRQMYVDACAMNLIRRPQKFDVIVTTNLFGDILSDESSQAAGGLGMAPAANIGDSFALFEPVHGAAFDIAGTGAANPTSFILSIRMMLEWLSDTRGDRYCALAARRLETAVAGVVAAGSGTHDIGGSLDTLGFTKLICSDI